MKLPKYFLSGLVLLFIFSCDKPVSTPVSTDDIVYEQINDTIIGINKDTLNIFSSSALAIFEVYQNGKSSQIIYGAKIINKPTGFLCDCAHDFLCKSVKGSLNALNYNDFITGNAIWGSKDSSYSLADFIGKGERYLGFQCMYFPSGVSDYKYGWVRLYCSPKSDTLIIIDYALNRILNKGIKAGQQK
jgi:hypothetical protein